MKSKFPRLAITILSASLSLGVGANPESGKALTSEQLSHLPFYIKQGYEQKLFTVKDAQHIKEIDMTMYAVHSPQSGDGLFFAKNGYLFIGNIIDGAGVSITEKLAQKYATPLDFTAKIDHLKSANIISYGTGPNEAYVFLDPRCPHCVNSNLVALETNPNILQNYTLKIVMVGFVAPNSKHMAEQIISRTQAGEDFVRVWRSLLNDNIETSIKTPLVDENLNVMRQVGVDSTPTVIVRHEDKWLKDDSIFK